MGNKSTRRKSAREKKKSSSHERSKQTQEKPILFVKPSQLSRSRSGTALCTMCTIWVCIALSGGNGKYTFQTVLLLHMLGPFPQSHLLVSSSSSLGAPKQPRPSPFPMLRQHPIHSPMKESSHHVVNYLSDVFSQ